MTLYVALLSKCYLNPQFPNPVVSVAIEPMSRMDQDRLTDALRKLADEDPTFVIRVKR